MRVVLQRVTSSVLHTDGSEYSRIGYGLLLLVGIEDADTADDTEWLCAKVTGLRVFDDDQGVMNLDITDIGGEIMVVSQFTLLASTRKGNRPSYTKAARPDVSRPLYESFISTISEKLGRPVATGVFGAHMEIDIINDGPVTIILDSKNKE